MMKDREYRAVFLSKNTFKYTTVGNFDFTE